MPSNTTDQQIPRPVGTDSADNPVAITNQTAIIEQRLVRTYTNEADRTARMLILSENDISALAAEDRIEAYSGTTHLSLFTRSLWADKFRITDATAINNSTTLVSDSVLVAALPAAGRFHFDLTLFYDSSTTADIKVAFTIPAGATIRWGGQGPSTAVSAGIGTGQFGVVIASGTSLPFGGSGVGTANTMMTIIRGTVVMGGTAGNLQTQYAQQTLDATNTVVREHSRLQVWKVAAA
jgi:hypothetical protein